MNPTPRNAMASSAGEPTATPTDNSPPPPPPRARCRIAMTTGSSTQFATEITELLRSRLRIVTLIGLGAFSLFLVRALLSHGHQEYNELGFGGLTHILHMGVIATQLVLAGLLWSRLPLSECRLRLFELVFFGTMGAFFAWLHYAWFHNGKVLDWSCKGLEQIVVRLASNNSALRWFALVVGYGMFIPNTWRRCALIVGIIAVTPVAMSVAIGLLDEVMQPYAYDLVIDLSLFMCLAATIAVFGSYKISALHHEALQARKLGQYQLKRRLGAGGMGEVYLAEHQLLRRPCAIKLIRPDQAGDARSLARFEREVQAMATLTHWNAVEIYDYGHSDDGTFYYVMEYLPGLSLQELVDRHGPLPPARAVHLLRQVCHALREAHGTGLIHRDIKPSNVIACERGGIYDIAKLLDFGLVQNLRFGRLGSAKLTQEGALAGSPQFMSPEQAAGRSDLDLRTDIYSLGAVAYFILTGQLPFERDNPIQMLVAHIHEPIVPLTHLRPDIPSDVEAVALRCLAKDPAQRFPDADSLARALAACQCAGEWTEELAAHWWRTDASQDNGRAVPERLVPTEIIAT
jgi:serine/threonine-protein kinase